jgi:hypothetical protein
MEEENYYHALDFLDKAVENKEIDSKVVLDFKTMIRDNKYVSTYIRSLRLKMDGFKSTDDFIKAMDKHTMTKGIEDVVEYEVRQLMDSIWDYKAGVDPIQVINDIIYNALEREGKICDFRDSVNPDKIFGRCQNDQHQEVIDDIPVIPFTEEEQKEYDRMCEDEDGNEAYHKFIDNFNPETELELTLGQDMDINKFDDSDTYYICGKCMEDCKENGECEVSCDMG